MVALTVKVGLSTADDVTDSTTEPTELVASVAAEPTDELASSRLSATSALAMAAQPIARRAVTRMVAVLHLSEV